MVCVNDGRVLIVSPAVASNNNGNWQTAARWQQFLSDRIQVDIVQHWDGSPAAAMIALHAHKSADDVRRFRLAFPNRPIALVFTGTDIYGDVTPIDQGWKASRDASHLVVLQELALDKLDMRDRSKARVVLQSAPELLASRLPVAPPSEFIAVGHLREVKDPLTFMKAARALREMPDVHLVHIGDALDRSFAETATLTMNECSNYRWLGPLSHHEARSRIANARAFVHMSRTEGGANVVIEAIRSDVPVIASHIDGNVGLLGRDYEGYFPVGDFAALAKLICAAQEDEAFHARLRSQCATRAPRFAPTREMHSVRSLLHDMLPRLPAADTLSPA